MAAYIGQFLGGMPGWLAIVIGVLLVICMIVAGWLWLDACYGTGEGMKWIRRRTYDKK